MSNESRRMTYSELMDICFIDAKEEEFVPKYLQYVLELNNIPPTAKIVFTRDQPKSEGSYNNDIQH